MQATRRFSVGLTLAAVLTLMFDPIQAQQETVDREAKEQAEKFFYSLLTKCEDSYYVQDISYVYPPPPPHQHPLMQQIDDVGIMTLELKDMHIEIDPDGLTNADKLHSIEWQGIARLNARSRAHFQQKSPQLASHHAGWSEWQEDIMVAPWIGSGFPVATHLQKKDGQWSIDHHGTFNIQKSLKNLKPVACNAIHRSFSR
jgi:hypothetical protein